MKAFEFAHLWDEMKPRQRKRRDEDRLQEACVKWFGARWPRYRLLLHHSPNEGMLPKGRTDGAKRKRMGVRAGFPDLVLMMPDGCYSYLAIELKTDEGRQSFAQKAMEEDMVAVGGCYRVVRGLDEFIKVVGEYVARYEVWRKDVRINFEVTL